MGYLASRSNSAVGASPNKARLPSLKQLSDRLGAPAAAASPSDKAPAAALSEITTNVPAPAASPSATPSRLKLPASAISRAHLTGAPSVRDDAARASSPDSSARSDKKEGASAAASDTEGKDAGDIGEVRMRVGRGLGVGLPGASSVAPETPVKKAAAATAKDGIPTTVVTVATPDKGSGSASAKTSSAPSQAAIDAVRERGEHPLAHSWALKYDSKTYKPDSATAPKPGEFLDEWEATLLNVGTFDSVEGFARLMNNIRLPGKLPKGANYHLFKDGIRPLWEDPANLNGGKWVLLFRNNPVAFDAAWANLVMGLVGEITDTDDQVCGIVASARPKLDRIQVWTRGRDDAVAINALGARILEAMALDSREQEAVSMEFQFNSKDTAPVGGKFMRILSSQRSFTTAPTGTDSRPRSARVPSSPLATPGGFSNMAPPPVPSLPGSPSATATPMRRTGSATSGGVGNPFAGPMGSAVSSAPRRLVSTPALQDYPPSPRPGA
ncbi:hypothetical protein Q8F55_006941 [Vanrija albida]|uniref:Translation initiation factor eIF4e n=1 Tax=Vanrija albida TaxID=181172 RepID=A0ABR3PZF4_9TREE